MVRDSLGDRMKGYENIFRFYFTRRMPLIVRIDGKAFHSFTKGFKRPFDPLMMQAMQKTAAYLCAHIEGCALAYTQSDEISLLLIDYTSLDTQPWFGKNLQKIASVAASMATMAFNQAFYEGYYGLLMDIATDGKGDKEERVNAAEAVYERKLHTAMFDARAFVLPKEEVCNYFIWRQLDAARNSIEMVGRAHFSHSALHKKTCRDICEMLMNRVVDPVVWESLPADQRHGACVVRRPETMEDGSVRRRWTVDREIPKFTEDRDYIDRLVFIEPALEAPEQH